MSVPNDPYPPLSPEQPPFQPVTGPISSDDPTLVTQHPAYPTAPTPPAWRPTPTSSLYATGPVPPAAKPPLWQRWTTSSTRFKWGVSIGGGCATLLLICGLCAAIGALLPSAATPTGTTSTGGSAHVAGGHTATPGSHTTTVATVHPTAKPTAKPTVKPTPLPTATSQPTATTAPQPTTTPVPSIFLTVTCADAVDYSSGEVCVHTDPGAQLTITVTYCSGYTAKSQSLQGTFTADNNGNQSWYWTPETKCQGPADAYITDSWNGQYTTTDPTFNVQ